MSRPSRPSQAANCIPQLRSRHANYAPPADLGDLGISRVDDGDCEPWLGYLPGDKAYLVLMGKNGVRQAPRHGRQIGALGIATYIDTGWLGD